jgi:hypothetical protein
MRWGRLPRGGYGYRSCGCDVLVERRFGDLVVPSEVTVAWDWPGAAPFFRARVSDLAAATTSWPPSW